MKPMKWNLEEMKRMAQSGRVCDVDRLMAILEDDPCFVTLKMVDFVLGLVSNPEGESRIGEYLLGGETIQRNYACLYFKRKGRMDLVNEAHLRGLIDEVQAFSR